MTTNLLVIGSHALRKTVPGNAHRGKLDLDIICTSDALVPFINSLNIPVRDTELRNDGQNVTVTLESEPLFRLEAEIAWPGTTAEQALQMLHHHMGAANPVITPRPGNGVMCADKDLQLALKLSHRYKKNSPHFLKTMADIHMLRAAGALIADPVLAKWLKRRTKETLNYKHPSLMQSKKDFFKDDGIQYMWDHDSIHLSQKHLDKPAYAYFKPEDREVLTDKGMFFALPKPVQLLAVLEESYVLAIERSYVPHRDKEGWTAEKAFNMALMKVCTSITSGWFREFAWENFYTVKGMYDARYTERFEAGIRANVVKPFTKERMVA